MSSLLVFFYIKNTNEDTNEAKCNQPRTPLRLKSNAAPRLFRLTVFYRGLKHEYGTDFSGREVNGKWQHRKQRSVIGFA